MSEQLWSATQPYAGGFRGDMGALPEGPLRTLLAQYKRQVAKRYRVIEPEYIERALPEEELHISAKLDGELWFLVKVGQQLGLVAYNGRVLTETAMLRECAALKQQPNFVVAGELLATPPGAPRARHNHVPNAIHDEAFEHTLSFHAFDLVEDHSLAHPDALRLPYDSRATKLAELIGTQWSRVRLAKSETGTPTKVRALYKELVATQGFEGLVVRSERGLTYKIKPTRTIDVVVLAYGERLSTGANTHEVRELEVGLLRDDGNYQLLGSVGGGFQDADRIHWHQRLLPLAAASSFRLANREGTLCRFVRPEIIVEVQISDLLAQDSWDLPIKRMTLAFDKETGYRALHETRTAVMIHPVFLRERTDKTVDVGSVGFSQIAGAIDDADAIRAQLETERKVAASIVKRGVYRKETKGQIAVRKYVILETHKHQDGTHAPFVCFFTDYSAGRKEPLATQLRTAGSLEVAEKHVALWLTENLKKGWEEVRAPE